jgi:FixJ family two-component response regulator
MSDVAAPLIHVVDDDDSLRAAISRLLTASGYRVAAYESAARFLESPPAGVPGCILLDIDMPGLSGLQLQEHLAKAHSGLPIVFLTGHGNIPMSVRAIKAGAEDFLAKPVAKADLIDAIQRALQRYNETHLKQTQLSELRRRFDLLTPREKEVFHLLIQGMLNKQVAFALGNTERTVKAHRHSIMEKMGVKSLAELVAIASQFGLLDNIAATSAT